MAAYRPKILFADDSEIVRRTVGMILDSVADLTCVDDGETALSACAAEKYDLVLLDIYMPVMDGMVTCAALRKQGFDGPIYALSADLEVCDRAAYQAAGFSGFVPKPIQPRELLEIALTCAP